MTTLLDCTYLSLVLQLVVYNSIIKNKQIQGYKYVKGPLHEWHYRPDRR
jgi:hypothetical protein